MTTNEQNIANINLSNSTFKSKNLGSCLPFAFYNMLHIKKTMRYIASRENIDFDLNSVVRFLVCDTIIDIDRKVPITQKLNSHFISCSLNDRILSTTVSLLAKYNKTILRAIASSFCSLGLKPKSNIGMFFLLNNTVPKTDSVLFNMPYLRNLFNKTYSFTGVCSDFLGMPEQINFSEQFFDTNTSVRKLKTKAKQLHRDHFCVMTDYSNINNITLSRLIDYGQTFCINTISTCPLYNETIHDWIVDPHIEGEAIYDGYIKERTIQCKLPSSTNKKEKLAELRLVCLKSRNVKKAHEKFININGPDEGWLCSLTNEDSLTHKHMMHKRFMIILSKKVLNVLKDDFFGKPILSNQLSSVLGHYVILALSLAIINCIFMMLGFPHNLVDASSELAKYNLRYVDKDIWISNELTKFSKELFGLINKEPEKFMNNSQIKSFFKQKENADILKKRIVTFTSHSDGI